MQRNAYDKIKKLSVQVVESEWKKYIKKRSTYSFIYGNEYKY